MGLCFRKSINLGLGIRLNLSKSGIGISTGVKGFRVSSGPRGTKLTASIPGTGIYYTKTLSSKKQSTRSRQHTTGRSAGQTQTRAQRYPYTHVVTNAYTGTTRQLQAATPMELALLVEAEIARQRVQEERQRAAENKQNQKDRAAEMTRQMAVSRESLKHLISDALMKSNRLDWERQLQRQPFKTFQHNSINGQSQQDAFRDYAAAKIAYENEQRKHNTDVEFLREAFEKREKLAIEKYASIVLANSHYPSDIDLDYDLEYLPYEKKLIVNCLLPQPEIFPFVEEFRYVQSRDEIQPKLLKDKEAQAFYERTLVTIGIRTIHELFEAIYNESVSTIEFHGFLIREEIEEDDFDDLTDKVNKVYFLEMSQTSFQALRLSDQNIENIVSAMKFQRVDNFLNANQTL